MSVVSEEWTALHWSAVEGNLEVCHRLLIALANPLQVDQAGGSCEVMRTVIHQEMMKL